MHRQKQNPVRWKMEDERKDNANVEVVFNRIR